MKPLYQRADFPMYRANRVSRDRSVIFPVTEAFTQTLGYLAAYCLEQTGLEVYALTAIFNHEHNDLGHPPGTPPEADPAFSKFYELFHGLIAELERLLGWEGKVWCPLERTHQTPVLTRDEILRCIVYDMLQAVAADLVERASDYPGLCLLPENVTKPAVFRRTPYIRMMDPDQKRFKTPTKKILLGIPQGFRHLSRYEYRRLLERAVRDRELELAEARTEPVKGIEACYRPRLGDARKPLPAQKAKQKPPQVYPSSGPLQAAYVAERATFRSEHRKSRERMCESGRPTTFPTGTVRWRQVFDVPIAPALPGCWTRVELLEHD